MKKFVTLLLFAVLTLFACEKEAAYTGDLIVITDGVQNLQDVQVRDLEVGLFDINALADERYFSRHALEVRRMTTFQVRFENINPGNYVVAVINYSQFRQAVQVKADETVEVKLF